MTAPGLVDPHAALRRAGDGPFGHAVAIFLDGEDEVLAVVASDDADLAPRVARRILDQGAEHFGKVAVLDRQQTRRVDIDREDDVFAIDRKSTRLNSSP